MHDCPASGVKPRGRHTNCEDGAGGRAAGAESGKKIGISDRSWTAGFGIQRREIRVLGSGVQAKGRGFFFRGYTIFALSGCGGCGGPRQLGLIWWFGGVR